MVTLIAAILFAALAFNQFYSGVNLYHGRQAQWKHRMDSLFTCILHRQSGETCRQPAAILARVDSLMRQGLGKSGSRLRIEYVFRDSLSNPMATYPPQATDSRHDGPLSAILPVDGHPGSLVEIRYNYPFLRFLGEARAETSSLALLLLLLAGCAMFLVRSYRRQHRNAEKQEEMMLQVMHEVNRPLVNIDMYTDLIRECSIAPDDRDGQEYAQAIKENIVQLKASTQNLLRRLTALQELRVKKEVFDFKDELEKLLRSHNHNSKVRFTLDYRLPLSIINASQVHLLNAISNLLDNAGKYSYDGDEVFIRCLSDGDNIRVEVEDHGPGIPPEKQAAIFQRYYRNEALRKVGKASGFGLGLPYVRQVVEGHRGRLSLESVLGKGCTFKITLPKDFIYGK